MTNQQLANISVDNELIFDPKNLTKETIKRYLCSLASDQELSFGLQVAKTFNLNPLKREIYFVKYSEKDPMQILTGYEVYLKRAERSGKYGGMKAWTEGTLTANDFKGCVEVYRKDWEKPLYHEAFYSEYVQMKNVYDENKKFKGKEPNKFWKEKPATMIKKVAISQAFRMAFPDEFDGMPYTREEVVDTEPLDVKIVDVPIVKTATSEPITVDLKTVDFITLNQVDEITKIAVKKGMKLDDLNEWLKNNFGYNKRAEIEPCKYDQIIQSLKDYKKGN